MFPSYPACLSFSRKRPFSHVKLPVLKGVSQSPRYNKKKTDRLLGRMRFCDCAIVTSLIRNVDVVLGADSISVGMASDAMNCMGTAARVYLRHPVRVLAGHTALAGVESHTMDVNKSVSLHYDVPF